MRSIVPICFVILCTSCEPTLAQAVGSDGVTHEVKQGETLYAIATRYYGNGLLWPEIRRHNPWVQPGHLHKGETIYIPPIDPSWKRHTLTKANTSHNPPYDDIKYEQKEPLAAAEPEELEDIYEYEEADGNDEPNSFANIPGVNAAGSWVTEVSSKKFFGIGLPHAALTAVCGLFTHALIQSILVWLAAVLTFVKDTSFRRSMKAVFMAETLTFATVAVLGTLAVIMSHVGNSTDELQSNDKLFPILENYMQTSTGIFVVIGALLTLYSVLSLRFYPQIMKIKTGQAFPILLLAVLTPHLTAMYLIGQRLGILPTY